MKRKFLFIFTCLLFASCGFFSGSKTNVKEDSFVYISSNATYKEVLDSLKSKLKSIDSFDDYAKSKKYPTRIKPGKYKLKKGETNKSLVNKLILGEQMEVSVRIKNEPTLFHLAGSVAKYIEADSTQIIEAIINWGKEKSTDLNAETMKEYFIPNTYHFYWATSGDDFVKRMLNEYEKIWNDDRKAKASKMNFTPLEVVTLASIVQLESYIADEQPLVARAYLNRLKIGKKLEADPTSIYAYKLQNGFEQTINRVYSEHTSTPSDYNTYIVYGLPPAPICLPNLSAVDAVLNPAEHNYIYFVANPDKPGYHVFTSSYEEHKRNARKYRNWANENNIR